MSENLDPNISDKALEAALAAAEKRSQGLDDQIAELQTERESARREAQLLRELVNLRHGSEEGEGAQPSAVEDDAFEPTAEKSRTSSSTRPPHPAVVASISELESAGKPLHISELMRLLAERGVEIPGSGQQANLINYLMRSPEISRPSRGMYALDSWNVQAPLKPARRTRAKGRRKQSSKER